MKTKIEQTYGIIPTTPYSKYSKKVFFEYTPGNTSFQLGYLGVNNSTIEGILRLKYTEDKPIFAKKIVLSFTGKEVVNFAGTLEEGQDIIKDDDESEFDNEEVSTTSISTHKAKRKFFSSSIIIWKSQSKGHYEGVKNLDLPFKLDLPNNLPPSVLVNRGCGRIYYMLKAVISRTPIDPNSRNKKKIIKYVIPIVRYTITPQPEPIRWFKREEGLAKLHVMDYDVSVTRSNFGSGESVVIPVKLIFHEPHVYLKKIFVGLKEYQELRADKYEISTKKYLVKEIVQADSIPISNGPDNECFTQVKFNIPFEREMVYDIETTHLSVSHKLKIKINLGGAPDLYLSNFVKIENIISEDEIIVSPPPKIEIPQEVIVTHEPIMVKPKRESYRRLTPFFPLFNKIQNDVDLKKVSLKIQPIKLYIIDSKNPTVIYNSRSLIVHPQYQLKQKKTFDSRN